MPYENISGTKVTFLDGDFKIPVASTQDRILVIGPAKSGNTNDLFSVANVAAAETEFGADTALMRVVHEAVGQGANNVAVIRSGGLAGSWVLTDSLGATLTIEPESRDDEILSRYKLFIENDGVENRYMIYDDEDQAWIYDSKDILIIYDGDISVEDTGIGLFTLFDRTDIEAASTMDAVLVGDFTPANPAVTAASIVATQGSDGIDVSLAEKYAALNETYHFLDYKDANWVIPTGVYIDSPVVADQDSATYLGTGATDAELYGQFWKGLPEAQSATDVLGYVWEYRHLGNVYTYMTDVDDYVAGVTAGAVAASATAIAGDIDLTAQKAGKGGNAVTIQVADVAGKTAEVSITETDYGFDILVEDDIGTAASATSLAVSNINTALGLTSNALKNGVLPSSLVLASGGSAALLIEVGKTPLSGGLGGALLTPEDLTGAEIPAAVSTKFAAAAASQFREASFLHQLATFCHLASRHWNVTMGAMSFSNPFDGYGVRKNRKKVAEWVGETPTYTDDGEQLYIDSPSDNGSGVLGHKLIAGESKTGAGYRSSLVAGGDSTDGIAYGGIIATVGSSLPNGTDWPYGIKDSDEAKDSGGKPVDIGRHVLGYYDWPIQTNSYNGGSTYRGDMVGLAIGKIVTLPENEEPIGANGRVIRVQSPLQIHSTQLDELAKQRVAGLREDVRNQFSISSSRTLAHPDSTYNRISTMRSSARILEGIRSICRPYIGKSYSAQYTQSLQAAIDAYLVAERAAGFHQGAKAAIQFTRQDRVMGRMTIKLRMVPPFSIETIYLESSLAADESEL